ncbi:metallophosphoesterase family protein [Deinococcus sp. YIM 134068]|uniref:metallophosphoesterase family protein n=1 Tax=Deinococcus lichenicola TaxID=3118910 RepID=UPI002F9514B3
MRLLLLSDIHANQAALEAVLHDAAARRYDRIVHLGDAVGYGPHPAEVLRTLRDLNVVGVTGNHDAMLLDYADGRRTARESVVSIALRWQLERLSSDDLALVRGWPDGVDDPEVGARYRHGSPASRDEYIDSVTAAREAFAGWEGRLAFVGHTHIPGVYATLNAPVGEWIKFQGFPEGGSYLVPPGARVILNPGSVGQPRDGNPRASYGVFDTGRGAFEVFRVAYDVERTQEAALEAGLPQVLAARLAIGK